MGIKPRLREPLETILRNSLATWDLSFEELPQYFAEKFRAKDILSTLDALETESTRSDQELVAIRSFRFFLLKYPTNDQLIIPLACRGKPMNSDVRHLTTMDHRKMRKNRCDHFGI